MIKVRPPRFPNVALKNLGKIYDQSAEMYERLSRCQDSRNDILKFILKKADLKNKVVLDMGAGSGKLSIPMALKAKQIYAMDISKPMLKILRRKIKSKKMKNIRVLESGYSNIPLPNESVDLIVSLWSFPAHSSSWERDLKEARRVLKKGGEIILIDSNYGGEYQRIKKKVKDPEFTSKLTEFNKNMHKWLASKGFRYSIIKTLSEFGSKRNVEKACGPFFGYEISTYLLARDRTSFHLNISVFYWKKPS